MTTSRPELVVQNIAFTAREESPLGLDEIRESCASEIYTILIKESHKYSNMWLIWLLDMLLIFEEKLSDNEVTIMKTLMNLKANIPDEELPLYEEIFDKFIKYLNQKHPHNKIEYIEIYGAWWTIIRYNINRKEKEITVSKSEENDSVVKKANRKYWRYQYRDPVTKEMRWTPKRYYID